VDHQNSEYFSHNNLVNYCADFGALPNKVNGSTTYILIK